MELPLSSPSATLQIADDSTKGRLAKVPLDFIIALLLLLTILVGFAIYSSNASKQIAEDSKAIGLASRQRMLSERQAKLMYRVGIGHNEDNPIDKAEALSGFKQSHKLYGDTLSAFSKGGETEALDSKETVSLEPVDGKVLRGIVAETEGIWRQYQEDLDALLSTRLSKVDGDMITLAADSTREINEPLLNLSSSLAAELQVTADERVASLRRMQQFALIGSILLLLYIAARVIRNLKSSGDELKTNFVEISNANTQLASTQTELAKNAEDLQAAYSSLQGYSAKMEETSQLLQVQQEESETIFAAVGEGLFLVDRKYKIGHQVSDEMYEIFEVDHLTDRSLIDLMRPLITERDVRSLEGYLDLQFDPNTSETQLEKYNPLKKIEVTLDWDGSGGGFSTKNLGFNFQRVLTDDDEVSSVLVTVNDVTETVRLENELARANESRERQSELILEVIESDPKELDIFLKKSEATLNEINEELEASNINEQSDAGEGAGKKLIESVFGKVHNIKGNASLLRLQSIVDTASTVEEKLSSLRRKKAFKGDELLSSLVELAYMREVLTEFEELRASTLSSFKSKRRGSSGMEKTKTGQLVDELQHLTDTIASEKGKEVAVHASGLDLDDMSSTGFQHSKDLLIQLVRNSVIHGVEDIKTREKRNKWVEGAIQIKSTKDDSEDNALGQPCYAITYRDDGGGIDPDVVAKRAVELELINEEDRKNMSGAECSALIFDHGFSSVDVSDDHAGRGAGMGLVRNIVNKTLGGKLRMTYETGEYLEFTILIPQKSPVAVS